ncbi:MAG TPA: hypothetical protein VFS21_12560 [Roseiflexaceae bacterium]|nr:hypothetical protein [Roseiflexaceae bacterium]
MTKEKHIAKAPRWVSTEASLWAWSELDAWRATALNTFAVAERQALLHEAEQLHKQPALVEPSVPAEQPALVEQHVLVEEAGLATVS